MSVKLRVGRLAHLAQSTDSVEQVGEIKTNPQIISNPAGRRWKKLLLKGCPHS